MIKNFLHIHFSSLMFFKKKRRESAPIRGNGFLLVEAIISVAIFAILVLGIYQISIMIIRGVKFAREEVTISALADQYLEIVRNLPYSTVGTINGNPNGNLPDQPNAVNVSINGNSYQIYYAVSYVDDPADGTILAGTDPAPNDYKQVKLYVKDIATNSTNSFLTNVSPQGLENMASGGALYIEVFNAVGQPVPNATVNITNNSITPNINLTRTTGSNGDWIEVGLPNSANSYHIVVTKNGYSTDQTYPSSQENPNPTKPDATISNGQVTKVSFSIDLTSNLSFNVLNQSCSPLSGIGLANQGAKLIGVNPDVPKFYNTYSTDLNGQIFLNKIEWDNYTPALISTTTYMVYGSSPIQEINLLPNTSQTDTLILGPSYNNSVLVIVKDSATLNPIEGAEVNLLSLSAGSSVSKVTGGSVWNQNDWTGGAGQTVFIDPTKYFTDSGTVDANGTPSGLRLADFGGSYANSGSLISSIFDTGTSATSYATLTWQPTSQNPSTGIKFQIASSNDAATSTWNFIGPDGTAGSYYTTPGQTITSANNGKRYVRYEVFLQTSEPSQTPVLSNVDINYVSGCFTPGQVMFPGFDSGQYDITASSTGYQTQTVSNVEINPGYNVFQFLMSQ